MLYGLLSYNFDKKKLRFSNIGDNIQSIAARQFLPSVDFFINREELALETKHTGKIILNAWYAHSDNAWPPYHTLIPLLTSIHVALRQKNAFIDSFISLESRKIIEQHGPVGARDSSTLNFLKENEIPSFFSGCMTLTLQRDPTIEKEDFILAVDVPISVLKEIKKRTKRKVYIITSVIKTTATNEKKIELGEKLLVLYQKAHCVITSRLHAALPSTALETPVLLIHVAKDRERFAGLSDLVRNTTVESFLKSYDEFNIDAPIENPPEYKVYRTNLIKQCEAFTECKCASSFMWHHQLTPDHINVKKSIKIFTYTIRESISRYMKYLISFLSSK